MVDLSWSLEGVDLGVMRRGCGTEGSGVRLCGVGGEERGGGGGGGGGGVGGSVRGAGGAEAWAVWRL